MPQPAFSRRRASWRPVARRLLGLALAGALLGPAQPAAGADPGQPAPSQAASQDASAGTDRGATTPLWRAVGRPSVSAAAVNTQTDYGLGVSVTTPFLHANRVAMRLGLERQFVDGVPKGEAREVRHGYTVVRGGAVGLLGVVASHIYLYGEGGLLYLMPEEDLASDSAFGGYAQVGLEFFPRMAEPRRQYSVFVELGLRGAPGAEASGLKGEPFFGNGFTTRAGLRYSL